MLRNKTGRGTTLNIKEIYTSIQGEGIFVGTPCIFVRFQGCNLRCPWCDEPSSLGFTNKERHLEDIMDEIEAYPHRHVVLTGGEPFAHDNLHKIVFELLNKGYSLQMETNGTLWNRNLDSIAHDIHITCSPKWTAGFYVHPKILLYLKELKFVVDDVFSISVLRSDKFISFLERGCVVLQPESNKPEFLYKALSIQKTLLKDGYTVRVIPQVHKIIGLK
ncbi:MAG: 7-carboxy-7-deazaguanine synthase QueE [Aquificaceae bacterium]